MAAKTFRVIYESGKVKALRDPSKAAQRIHLVEAKDEEEAVKLAGQAEMRHGMRLLDEAQTATGANKTFLEQRADLSDWKLKSAEEVK